METVKMTKIHCDECDYEFQHLFNNYNIYELQHLCSNYNIYELQRLELQNDETAISPL